jgi:hypothetical protein
MNPRMLPFSQVIGQERRRWRPFRRALSKEDQEACDRMFTDATQPLQAAGQAGRPWRGEAHGRVVRPHKATGRLLE